MIALRTKVLRQKKKITLFVFDRICRWPEQSEGNVPKGTVLPENIVNFFFLLLYEKKTTTKTRTGVENKSP